MITRKNMSCCYALLKYQMKRLYELMRHTGTRLTSLITMGLLGFGTKDHRGSVIHGGWGFRSMLRRKHSSRISEN